MQMLRKGSECHRAIVGGRRWTALVLSIGLVACHASDSGQATPAGAVASPGAATSGPAEVHRPAPQQAPEVESTAADAMDDDVSPRRPDDSYRKANLRPSYDTCVDASGGATPALQACGDEEFAYQRSRLRAAFAKIVEGPDGKEKDALMDAQAAYMDDTDRYCTWNPEEEGQGQMLDAQSCRLNRMANRADELTSITSK